MKIHILKRYSCEPTVSARDERVHLVIDDKVVVVGTICSDKHNRELGNFRLENVTIDESTFSYKNFDALPSPYDQENLEERNSQFLADQ